VLAETIKIVIKEDKQMKACAVMITVCLAIQVYGIYGSMSLFDSVTDSFHHSDNSRAEKSK